MAQEHQNEGEAGGGKGLLNKMGDAVGGMVGMASASTAGATSADAFATNAAIADRYEIEAAELALQRSRSPEVRSFAAEMIEDHMASMHHMMSAFAMSETEGVKRPPHELDERRKGMVDHLRQASADDFDKTYLDQQELAHRENVTLLKGFAERGDNPQLQSVALGALPGVERHLDRVRMLKRH